MTRILRRIPVLSFCLVLAIPASRAAQDEPEPTLLPADAEAYAISQQLQFGCRPDRMAGIADSESTIENDPKPFVGKAAFVIESDNVFFLALERYGEDGSLHCAVFTRRGPPPAGRYTVAKLSESVQTAEFKGADEPFYAMFGYRTTTERSMLVVESGVVEITTSTADRVEGTFELSGFRITGATRTDDVHRKGSFKALKSEK